MKLWGVDMSRSRSFSLGQHSGIVRAVCRSKVSKSLGAGLCGYNIIIMTSLLHHCDYCIQGKILVGTQNSEVLEIEEKNGKIQVHNYVRVHVVRH